MDYRFKFDATFINKNRGIFMLCIIFALIFVAATFIMEDISKMQITNIILIIVMIGVMVFSIFGLTRNTYKREMIIIDRKGFSFREMPNYGMKELQFAHISSISLKNHEVIIKLKTNSKDPKKEFKIKNIGEVNSNVIHEILMAYLKKERKEADIEIYNNKAYILRNDINSLLTLVIILAVVILSYITFSFIVPTVGLVLFILIRYIEPKYAVRKIVCIDDKYFVDCSIKRLTTSIGFRQNNIKTIELDGTTLYLDLGKNLNKEFNKELRIGEDNKERIVFKNVRMDDMDKLLNRMETRVSK